MNGGLRSDTLYGGEDNDTILGAEDDDFIYGGQGEDSLVGGLGNDFLQGDKQSDQINGGKGDDSLYGGQVDDTLIGGAGNDFVSGDKGNDVLTGVDPNSQPAGFVEIDTLSGGVGNDTFVLGDGTQTYYVNGAGSIIGFVDYALIVNFNPTEDVILLGPGNYLPAPAPENLPQGTAIYLLTGKETELIAILDGITDFKFDTNIGQPGSPIQFAGGS